MFTKCKECKYWNKVCRHFKEENKKKLAQYSREECEKFIDSCIKIAEDIKTYLMLITE